MSTRSTAVAALFVSFFPILGASASAQVIRVPAQHTTIQAALNAATSGTLVLVAPGTYNELITWPSTDGIELRSEQGAATTIIDGTQSGTVMTFGSGLTRATIVRGFTIRNGLMTTTRNNGVGVVINNGSPVFHENRLTGHIADGPNWNYGGAVHVSGTSANPLFLNNEIDNNILRNGSWCYGAGIYVESRAKADIIGNRIHDNVNESLPPKSGGRGHGAGIYASGTVLIASNLIYNNTNKTSAWNYGAGLKIDSSATVSVFNNTFVNNVCTTGSWTYGGGIHMDATATVSMIGNIVAGNSVSNSSFVQGGGIYATGASATITLDYNNVWNNTGGDFQAVTPGSNGISVDPLFASATDFHLTAASPCVDAVPSTHLTAIVDTDVDTDPRQLDGDLDGGATDGARLDMGADEFSQVKLAVLGTPALGGSITFNVTASTLSLHVMALSVQTGNFVLQPWGNLLLGGTMILPWNGTTPGNLPVGIPNTASLVGLSVYAQSLVTPLASSAGQFTNRVEVMAY